MQGGELYIKLASRLDTAQIAYLLGITRQIQTSNYDTVIFDFDRTIVFTPFSACYLSLLFNLTMLSGIKVRVGNLNHRAVRYNFQRMGLDRFININRKPLEGYIPTLPLQLIENWDMSKTTDVVNLIRDQLTLPVGIYQAVHHAVHELVLNVEKHSEASWNRYLCANAIPNQKLIKLCVLDNGIGIRESLAKNPKYGQIKSDVDAIKVSLEYGTSSLKDQDRGIGLNTLVNLIESNQGRMEIISGHGMVIVQSEGHVSRNLIIGYHGTIVNLIIRKTEDYRPHFNDWEAGVEKWLKV